MGKPIKVKRLCEQYFDRFGDTSEYQSLKCGLQELKSRSSWSQTMFIDGETLVVQYTGAPYGTTYLVYEGTVEEVLSGANENFFQLNPNRKSVLIHENQQ